MTSMVWIGALLVPAFLIGVIFLAVAWRTREKALRAAGDLFMAAGFGLIIVTWYALDGLELSSLSDYAWFVGFSLVAGILAGDALVQVLPKKSSSS